MRNFKRVLAAALAASTMLVSLAGCGSDEEQTNTTQSTETTAQTGSTEGTTDGTEEVVVEKPYQGMNFTVMIRDDLTSKYGPDVEMTYANDFFQTVYHALNEWCAENEATWTQLATSDTNVLMAAAAAGQSVDLYLHYNQFPSLPNLGLMQPIGDYYDELSEKYGSQFLDVLSYKGESYGLQLPSNAYGALEYDRTIFEQLGVKLPKEYFMEGNWTWDTLWELCSELTRDLDGDGTMDVIGMGVSILSRFMTPSVQLNEDGTLTSLLDTDKYRDLAQAMYEGVMVTNTMSYNARMVGYPTNDEYSTDATIAMAIGANGHPGDISTLLHVNTTGVADNHIHEVVPLPVYNSEEEESVSINLHNIMIPTAAQSLDASVSLMDYVVECICEVHVPEMYDLEGLRGNTDASAEYLQLANEAYETRIAETMAMSEYDEEYIQAVMDYWADKDIWFAPSYSGVTFEFTSNTSYSSLWTKPAATSIAEILPVHQAQCDTYNSTYIFN